MNNKLIIALLLLCVQQSAFAQASDSLNPLRMIVDGILSIPKVLLTPAPAAPSPQKSIPKLKTAPRPSLNYADKPYLAKNDTFYKWEVEDTQFELHQNVRIDAASFEHWRSMSPTFFTEVAVSHKTACIQNEVTHESLWLAGNSAFVRTLLNQETGATANYMMDSLLDLSQAPQGVAIVQYGKTFEHTSKVILAYPKNKEPFPQYTTWMQQHLKNTADTTILNNDDMNSVVCEQNTQQPENLYYEGVSTINTNKLKYDIAPLFQQSQWWLESPSAQEAAQQLFKKTTQLGVQALLQTTWTTRNDNTPVQRQMLILQQPHSLQELIMDSKGHPTGLKVITYYQTDAQSNLRREKSLPSMQEIWFQQLTPGNLWELSSE